MGKGTWVCCMGVAEGRFELHSTCRQMCMRTCEVCGCIVRASLVVLADLCQVFNVMHLHLGSNDVMMTNQVLSKQDMHLTAFRGSVFA